VADAGTDYTLRTNKFAHQLVLDATELPPAGPAWALRQPGMMETAWQGEPRILPAGRRPALADAPARPCDAWQALTGDAGWGGVLAATASGGGGAIRPAWIVFRPGQDVLPLLGESLALLPAALRWNVTFCTYYTKLPAGIECLWKCALAGSIEEQLARRSPQALLLDLTRPLGQAPASAWSEAARRGLSPIQAAPCPVAVTPVQADDAELDRMLGATAQPPVLGPPVGGSPAGLSPIFTAPIDTIPPPRPTEKLRGRRGKNRWRREFIWTSLLLAITLGSFIWLWKLVGKSSNASDGIETAAAPVEPASVNATANATTPPASTPASVTTTTTPSVPPGNPMPTAEVGEAAPSADNRGKQVAGAVATPSGPGQPPAAALASSTAQGKPTSSSSSSSKDPTSSTAQIPAQQPVDPIKEAFAKFPTAVALPSRNEPTGKTRTRLCTCPFGDRATSTNLSLVIPTDLITTERLKCSNTKPDNRSTLKLEQEPSEQGSLGGGPIPVALFEVDKEGVWFTWRSSVPKFDVVRNSVLKISLGDQEHELQLRMPELSKPMSLSIPLAQKKSEARQVTVKSLPVISANQRIVVEFRGALASSGKAVDEKAIADVDGVRLELSPELKSDVITVTLSYAGIRKTKGSDDLTQVTAEDVKRHIAAQRSSLEAAVQTADSEAKKAKKDSEKDRANQEIGRSRDALNAFNADVPRLEKIERKLNELAKASVDWRVLLKWNPNHSVVLAESVPNGSDDRKGK